MSWTSFNHDDLDAKARYKLLSGAIVPRPIALVTTVSAKGKVNAAPFSFFNVLSADPGIVSIGVESREDGSFKDTARNIRETGEFVVNLVSRAMLDAMRICANDFPEDVDELDISKLRPLVSDEVRPPRIEASPASFECIRHLTLEISESRQIVVGMIRRLHFAAGVINPQTYRVDYKKLDLIGRLAGPNYVGLRDIIDCTE